MASPGRAMPASWVRGGRVELASLCIHPTPTNVIARYSIGLLANHRSALAWDAFAFASGTKWSVVAKKISKSIYPRDRVPLARSG
eukprot:9599552-Karenia_brevis.AAC.1